MKSNSEYLSYDAILIGKIYSFERTITRQDVVAFSDLTGDRNPLHMDENFGRESEFGSNIVHGMLIGSLFSTLVGMYCPGEKSLYMGQTLQFKLPLYINDHVLVRGTVLEKSNATKIIKLKTEVLRAGEAIITGEAKVKVMN
jgi:3-hydroxybutyryl-CoA dehydratase